MADTKSWREWAGTVDDFPQSFVACFQPDRLGGHTRYWLGGDDPPKMGELWDAVAFASLRDLLTALDVIGIDPADDTGWEILLADRVGGDVNLYPVSVFH